MALDKKMICRSYQRYKGRKRYFCSHFSVIFEITNKFIILFVRLILGKVRVDRFTGPRWKIDIRYEFGLQIILNDLRCNSHSCSLFWLNLVFIDNGNISNMDL